MTAHLFVGADVLVKTSGSVWIIQVVHIKRQDIAVVVCPICNPILLLVPRVTRRLILFFSRIFSLLQTLSLFLFKVSFLKSETIFEKLF